MALYTVMKGPVTYTVVGSPTITDGVVSGFSSSNRLETTSTFDPKKPYKIQAKFNLSTLGVSNTILGVATAGIFNFCVNGSNLLKLLIGNTNADWDVLNLGGTTVLAENTDYWAQAEFTGTQYILRLSTDGITWNQEASVTSSTVPNPGNPFTLRIGDGHTQHWYFRGSIDLKQTFIECENQLWFGYEPLRVKIRTAPYTRYSIVGNATVTNGVATNFSANNYLSLNPIMVDINDRDFEVIINATKLGGSGYGARALLWANNFSIDVTNGAGLRLRTWTKKSGESSYTERSLYNFNFSTNNNTQWIKVTKVGKVFSIEGSNNGTTYTTGHNYTLEEGEEVRAPSTTVFCQSNAWGTIGTELLLNNSYIKVDGQYWWRGDMQYVKTYTLHQGE